MPVKKVARKPKAKREISAGGVVFHKTENGINILLVKDSYGKWGLPKGHMEKGENLWKTALRETQEETGLQEIRYIAKIDSTSYFFREKKPVSTRQSSRGGKLIFKIVYYFLMETSNPKVSPQLDEIKDVKWIPENEALEKIEYKDLKPIIKNAIKLYKMKRG